MRGTVELLVNPFTKGETITIPAGAEYVSMAPNVNGMKTTKRSSTIVVHRINEAYTFDEQVHHADVVTAGAGGYWKHITLTEEILKANGKTPEYKTHKVIL